MKRALCFWTVQGPNVPTLLSSSSSFPHHHSFPFRGAIIERALSLASRAHEFPGRCFCAGGTSHQVVVVVFCLLLLRLGGVVGTTGCCFPSEWKGKKRRLLGHVSDFIRDRYGPSVSPPGEFRRAVVARHFPRAETRVAPFFRQPPSFGLFCLLFFFKGGSNVDARMMMSLLLRFWGCPPSCRRSPDSSRQKREKHHRRFRRRRRLWSTGNEKRCDDEIVRTKLEKNASKDVAHK